MDMKKTVEHIRDTIEQKATRYSENLEAIEGLRDENRVLNTGINQHRKDLVTFCKYLDEKTIKELELEELLSEKTTSAPPSSTKLNFGDTIVEALKKKAPQTAEELYEYYKKKKGSDTYSYSAFTAGLERLIKNDSVKAETVGKKTSKEHLIAFPTMFDGQIIKKEFLPKK